MSFLQNRRYTPADDVLGDVDGGASVGAGVRSGVLAVQAEGAAGQPAALVEACGPAPEAPPLDPEDLGPKHQIADVLCSGVFDEGRLRTSQF